MMSGTTEQPVSVVPVGGSGHAVCVVSISVPAAGVWFKEMA